MSMYMYMYFYPYIGVVHHGSPSGGNNTVNATFATNGTNGTTPSPAPLSDHAHIWQGVAFFLQNLFIFFRYMAYSVC